MDELMAPEEPYDQSGAVTVSLDGITTLIGVLVAPENFADYIVTRSHPVLF
jgi:hypothetical protein